MNNFDVKKEIARLDAAWAARWGEIVQEDLGHQQAIETLLEGAGIHGAVKAHSDARATLAQKAQAERAEAIKERQALVAKLQVQEALPGAEVSP